MEIRKDPYVVLGVSRQEGSDGIRHAFRELGARYHPDRTGGRTEPRYGDVLEAFQLLADPRERAGWNREHPVAPDEAVVPEAAGARPKRMLGAGPLSLFRDFIGPRSALAETFERLLRNFTGRHVPKAEALRPLDLELVLSREDARSGGVLTISVPTFRRCPACSGAGHDALSSCFACGGQGLLEETEPVRLVVPPGVASGTTFHLPLHGLGIGNLLLRVRVRADA